MAERDRRPKASARTMPRPTGTHHPGRRMALTTLAGRMALTIPAGLKAPTIPASLAANPKIGMTGGPGTGFSSPND